MIAFRKLNGSFAILRCCTFCLITILSSTSQWYILWPWYVEKTQPISVRHLVLFNGSLLYLYCTFFLACQDPGAVRPDYTPPEDAARTHLIRYCPRCKTFKPPRTHHCKSCGRCVLRMDHHCPWLDACVGYNNHAVFIKFLAVVVPVTAYLAYMATQFLLTLDVSTETFVAALFVGIVSSCICLMVSCLFIYQVWCAIENITTIESWTLARTEDAIRRRLIPPATFPYDLYSTRDNLRELFGTGWMIMWWWPTTRARGTGHAFKVNGDADPALPWPPKIPEADKDRALLASSRATTTESGELSDGVNNMRSRTTSHTKEDDMWDDEREEYLSEDSDDYVDGNGEYLDSYGVDEDDEISDLGHKIDGKETMAEVLAQKRKLQ